MSTGRTLPVVNTKRNQRATNRNPNGTTNARATKTTISKMRFQIFIKNSKKKDTALGGLRLSTARVRDYGGLRNRISKIPTVGIFGWPCTNGTK